ncbi:recombinase family protein [Streptomyces fractus]|uniref:recombinase family protein n=1 Tax=Streptomyces fractus TaxID=641806 RepID=UPI003CF66903
MAGRERTKRPLERSLLVLDSYARDSLRKGSHLYRGVLGQHEVNERRIAQYASPGGRAAERGLRLQDRGKTAWDAEASREGWEQLVGRLDAGESQGVVIFDLGRFVQQTDEAIRIAKFAEKGVVILDSDGEYDLDTRSGLKAFCDAVSAAQYYSHRLSTRTRRGLNQRIAMGVAKPGRFRAFGFEADANTVREPEAAVIRELMAAALDGEKITDLAAGLNAREIRTTAGGQWTPQTVRHLLKNPRIAGHITAKGEIVGEFPVEDAEGRPTGHPIVASGDWRSFRDMVESRRGAPPRTYLLTGTRRIVCGNCGSILRGKPAQNGRCYEDGEEARKYECAGGTGTLGRGCGKTLGDQRELDRFVSALVVRRLSDPQLVDQLRKRAVKVARGRDPHEKELDRLAGLVDHWDEQLNAGKITIERHNKLVSDVMARSRKEAAALAALGPVPDVPSAEVIDDARAKWDSAGYQERRTLMEKAFQGHYVAIDPGPLADLDFRGRVHLLEDDRSS